MFKLVVLSALLAVAVARPGGLFHGSVAYTSPVVAAVPAAVSHQSRVDVISEPVVSTHVVSAPIVEHAVVAAPAVAYAAPAVAVPAAVSHTSRFDVHSSPIVAAYAAPAYVEKSIIATPFAAVHGW